MLTIRIVLAMTVLTVAMAMLTMMGMTVLPMGMLAVLAVPILTIRILALIMSMLLLVRTMWLATISSTNFTLNTTRGAMRQTTRNEIGNGALQLIQILNTGNRQTRQLVPRQTRRAPVRLLLMVRLVGSGRLTVAMTMRPASQCSEPAMTAAVRVLDSAGVATRLDTVGTEDVV